MDESKIKDLVCELKDLAGRGEIIAIIYNPFYDEGMKEEDCDFLAKLFDNQKYTYPLFVLSGKGGDFSTGIHLPHLINKEVKNYRVYIPRICGSALCYTIFKAKELLVGENTKITQIDPLFEYNGNPFRAIKEIRSTDDILKAKARVVFDVAQKYILKLSSPPSVFKFDWIKHNDFAHLDSIAVCFMNKEDHDKPITVKELEEMEVNLNKIGGSEIDLIANEFIMACQDFTIENNVRVIFVSSVPIEMEGEGEGTFICPLP